MANLVSDWGGPSSNCYIDLTSANSFITSAIVDHSDWTGASTPAQEAAILEGARDIDSRRYIGDRYFYDQMLEFPRELAVDFPWNRTGTSSITFSVEHARMKQAVEQANCYQALHILRNAGRNLHNERRANGITSYSEKIGPIAESYTYARGQYISVINPDAINVLAPYAAQKRVFRA